MDGANVVCTYCRILVSLKKKKIESGVLANACDPRYLGGKAPDKIAKP
jgi:hypothetical protein